MPATQPLGPRAYLKSLGFALDKKPHQIDRLLLKSLEREDREELESIWMARNLSVGDGLDMYHVPKTLKQAALLFSYDCARAARTMEWFDYAVRRTAPTSIVEMGCGAGFLLGFLHAKYPEIQLQGIDAAKNLTQIGSQLSGRDLLAGDYLKVEPDGSHDLILCDFGFDMTRFKPSNTPHSIETYGGVQYCPGCSDDLKVQFDEYLLAWRRWGHADTYLAVAGRIGNFGVLRALVLSAADAGWKPMLEPSAVIKTTQDGQTEKFPALLFKSEEGALMESDIRWLAELLTEK